MMPESKPPLPKAVGFAVVEMIKSGHLDDAMPQIAWAVRDRQMRLSGKSRGGLVGRVYPHSS